MKDLDFFLDIKLFPFPSLRMRALRPKQLFGLMENLGQRSRATARARSNQADDRSVAPSDQSLQYCRRLAQTLNNWLAVIIQAGGPSDCRLSIADFRLASGR